MTTSARVRITCNCSTCETNAANLGTAFPMAAEVSSAMAAGLGITERNADKASKVHRLVATAHDPSLRASATVAKVGPWAL